MRLLIFVIALVLSTTVLACSDAETVDDPSAVDDPPPASVSDGAGDEAEIRAAWDAVTARLEDAADAMPASGMSLIVRDGEGVVRYRHTLGGFATDTRIPVASASKLVAALVVLRQVEQGELTLDTTTGEVLGWSGANAGITVDHLGSFTSGYEDALVCAHLPRRTLESCVATLADRPPQHSPGGFLHYSNLHLHVVGRMVEVVDGRSWNSVFREDLAEPLGLDDPDLRFVTNPKRQRGTTNPLVAGGLLATTEEMEAFWALVLAGGVAPDGERLLDEALVQRLFQNPYNDADVGTSPYESAGLDYRYGFGTWLECPGRPSACDVVSSSGAFGFTPWVDRARGYTGILAMEGDLGTATSFAVPLQQEIRPLVERAVDLEAAAE